MGAGFYANLSSWMSQSQHLLTFILEIYIINQKASYNNLESSIINQKVSYNNLESLIMNKKSSYNFDKTICYNH